jgi:DNA-binding NtrC family response regulator
MDNSTIQRVKQRYGIVGNCEALNRAIEIALKIAPVDLSVLITGENGVGKEVFPRIIHEHSLRKNKKYFAVNCGAIPEGTIDSELFGHEKGAFTGAVDQREGYFAVANGGTLFLDEVGELPLQTQARLLRVLETGEYIRVGASEVRKTDVRIVAATNVDMEKAISEGKFREDLYYRLNTISIPVPALRERGDDAALLFRKFALDMSERYKMPAIRLTEDAQRMLVAYSWPGNVRQLKNLTENMSVTAEEREINAEALSHYLPRESKHTQLVALAEKKEQHSFENEREILYQILFDLRRDVSELKRIVREQQTTDESALHASRTETPNLLFDHGAQVKLAKDAEADVPYWDAEEVNDDEVPSVFEVLQSPVLNTSDLKPAMAAKQPQSLNEVERDTIAKTLELCNGRRKMAAEQLGISERTLYRKIKEFGLE